jgi:hypothetical protein
MAELVESVNWHGIITPLTLAPDGDGFTIIARRRRAVLLEAEQASTVLPGAVIIKRALAHLQFAYQPVECDGSAVTYTKCFQELEGLLGVGRRAQARAELVHCGIELGVGGTLLCTKSFDHARCDAGRHRVRR